VKPPNGFAPPVASVYVGSAIRVMNSVNSRSTHNPAASVDRTRTVGLGPSSGPATISWLPAVPICPPVSSTTV
jgi:hypothetical protein